MVGVYSSTVILSAMISPSNSAVSKPPNGLMGLAADKNLDDNDSVFPSFCFRFITSLVNLSIFSSSPRLLMLASSSFSFPDRPLESTVFNPNILNNSCTLIDVTPDNSPSIFAFILLIFSSENPVISIISSSKPLM